MKKKTLLSARLSSCVVILRSLTTHACITYGLPLLTFITSSREVVEYDDKHKATPSAAAARDVPSSPSGCASFCIADGLNPNGNVT